MARIAFLMCTIWLVGSSALAQSVSTEQKAAKAAAVATAITTSDTNSVTQVGSVFSIEGSTADKKAAGQVGFQLNEFTLTVGAEAPLGDSQQTAILADLNGLTNKTTGKAAILWQHWDISLAAYAEALHDFCTPRDVPESECTYLNFKRLANAPGASALDKERFRELRNLNKGTVYFLGANAQFAPEEFAYLNTSDLSEVQEHHTSWSAAALVGVLFQNAVMLSVSYERQVAFTANDQTQVCSPIGTLNALQCSDHVVGAPGDPTRSHQTAVEVRRIFGKYFAISPKLTRDWSTKMTGAQVPLYFFQSKDGGLNGGVSLGYIFEKKSFTATAFIGQVLGLISQ